ncbi:hypothetical protein CERZMDRAFT_117287 [Cercospora zeae-maydis SCOH1-5]|uniref:Inheritance of peroxisomes protein 1 n=1 Tax=Cercospora zeae-maydis SCOH1-5 TaxID=717836 RepID=A0A6A6FJN3_9PEZI|nr:hypothetical protein CERZMDRAFT_117287 [Cercospora zeae-maydis SCOH1-5]
MASRPMTHADAGIAHSRTSHVNSPKSACVCQCMSTWCWCPSIETCDVDRGAPLVSAGGREQRQLLPNAANDEPDACSSARMSTTVPRTPEQPTRNAALNRSFSAASASKRASPAVDIGATEGVETLFTHPTSKVVKFTSSTTSRPSSHSGGNQNGSLPWATSTEKTMAAGPLEIYRVPGSVSFLHSGSLLHAILPRSNCWCVDGVSKFAMRVLPDTYYRIELPGDTPEDLERVEEFIITLQKVLFYERTACPFARTFSVDIPEEEEPKPRRRRRRTDGPAKKWRLDKAYSWKPEGWAPEQARLSEGSSGSVTTSDEEGSSGSSTEHAEHGSDTIKALPVTTPTERIPTVKDRARGIELRSASAPVQMLSLQPTPPSRLRSTPTKKGFPPSSQAPAWRGVSPRGAGVSPTRPGCTLAASPIPFQLHSAHDVDKMSNTQPSRASISQSQGVAVAENAHDRRSFQSIPTDMPPSPPDSNVSFDFESSRGTMSRKPLQHSLATPQYVAQDPALTDGVDKPVVLQEGFQELGAVGSAAAEPDQSGTELGVDDTTPHPDGTSTPSVSAVLEDAAGAFVTTRSADDRSFGKDQAERPVVTGPGDIISLPEPSSDGDSLPHGSTDDLPAPLALEACASDVSGASVSSSEQTAEVTESTLSAMHLTRVASSESDPYAAIQARIQARRSIGGTTTSFVPIQREMTRLSAISSASSSSLRSLSRRSQTKSDKEQVMATALVRRAASTFLGPPVNLVAIMLKIAARFAKGAFPKALLFESPAGMPKRVPGSFDLDDSDIEHDFDSEVEDLSDDGEDDFGVPLRSPIRIAIGSESMPRMIVESNATERKCFDLDE